MYIRYLVNFRKKSVLVLLDSSNEVNIVHPTFAKELGLFIKPIDIRMQKIDHITLDIYGIVVAVFLITDKANWVKFLKETFLVANVSPKVVLGMSFLNLSSADIDFLDQELLWRTYTINQAFPTIRYVKLIGKKKFAAAALDPKHKTFVVHVAFFSFVILPSFSLLNVYPSCRPQIAGLIAKEALTKVPAKYFDFANIFSPDLASKLLEHTGINNHTIKLVDDQQSPYEPIYSLKPVE